MEGDERGTSKLLTKRRKPRSSAVVSAANDRLLASAPRLAKPGVFKKEPRLSKVEEPTKRKGLRHFAVRVSKKVEQKQFTSYNEVADELVVEEKELKQAEVARGGKLTPALQRKLNKGGALVDEKNIRRRVYDSLNVLMAMGIIEKDRKVIQWRGIAMARATSQRNEIARLRDAVAARRDMLMRKRQFAGQVSEQTEHLTGLVARNRETAAREGREEQLPVPGAAAIHQLHPDRIGMPFILVGTMADAQIGLQVDRSCEDVAFKFNKGFTIYDDREVLRRMFPGLPLGRQASATHSLSLSGPHNGSPPPLDPLLRTDPHVHDGSLSNLFGDEFNQSADA